MARICNQTYEPVTTEKRGELYRVFGGLVEKIRAKVPVEDEAARAAVDLHDFQKYAIEAILTGRHVLALAHTGSGKTLPAEMAIDYFCGGGSSQERRKVIYTSPIKALSNQKRRDLQAKFPHISFGLITGDICVNPGADCLIMTTEVYRNTLYKMQARRGMAEEERDKMVLQFDIDVERELAAVIFDEVHYMNDPERGTVWDESIMNTRARDRTDDYALGDDGFSEHLHTVTGIRRMGRKGVGA